MKTETGVADEAGGRQQVMPETLFGVLLRSRDRFAERIAYVYQAGDREVRVNYHKLGEDVLLLSRALADKGVNRGDRVMFLSDNRYGWMVTDLAIMSLGAVSVPRGSDTPTEELCFIVEDSDCTHLVVETPELLDHHRSALKHLKRLKNYFVMTGPSRHKLFGRTHSYGDLLGNRTYSEADLLEFENRGRQLEKDDLLTIIYTSGTTGTPKGVRLTHGNIMHNIDCIPGIIGLRSADRWLSILPSWHIFERTAEYVALACGCCLVYSSVKRFGGDLETYRPTLVATVPRVWESLYSRVQSGVSKKSAPARWLFGGMIWVSMGFRRQRRVLLNRLPRFGSESGFLKELKRFRALLICGILGIPYLMAQSKLAMVRQRFGGRLRLAISGGGSLPGFIEDWIDAVGIRIVNAYGMTECAPAIAGRGLACRTYGTLGFPVPGTELRIVTEQGESCGPGVEGLIEVRGPQVTSGYENNPEENKESFTADGFFKTGDLGMLTLDDELIITGRAKDIIVLASGENVDPSRIESAISMFPFIEDAILVGQDKKGLGALLVPNLEELRQWAGSTLSTIRRDGEDLLSDNRLLEQVRRELNRLLKPARGFKPHEKLQGVAFLKRELIPGEEITNTFKKKRYIIEKKYRDIINQLLG